METLPPLPTYLRRLQGLRLQRLGDHCDTASAEAFFRLAIERAERVPEEVVTDHHQPYVKAVARTGPATRPL